MDPDLYPEHSRIHIKEFKYFNPKNCFQAPRKYDPGCSSRIRIRIFLPIPDPGVKKAPDPRSGSATLWLNILSPRRQRRQSRRENVFSSDDCCWRRSGYSPAAHPGPQPILTITRKIVNVKNRNDSLCNAVSFASVLKLNYPKDHVV